LSGSLNGWGDVLIPNFDVVIFLTTPREIRLQRLRVREAARFGADADRGRCPNWSRKSAE
jgi:uridine kinase